MMKRKLYNFLLTCCALFAAKQAEAQLVAPNCFLQGKYLEIGIAANGSFGGGPVPAGYHQRDMSTSPGTNLAMVYDFGHDGWTVGSPSPYYGDYTFPGTPFEGWSMQVNGARTDAFYTTSPTYGVSFYNAIPATSTLTGSNTSYTNVPTPTTCGYPNTGNTIYGVWSGSAGASGALTIRQTTTVDTLASWVNVTTVFKNTSTTTMNGLYYWRTADPDNEQTVSGLFTTTNWITQQNDVDHRVQVNSKGTTYANAYMSLATKDYRAKCLVYTNWATTPSTAAGNTLDQVYGGTASSWLGTTGYTVGYTATGDIAIGLIYNLGNLAAGDSTIISYAYVFSDTTGIDSAFPEPQLVVNCTPIAPSGPAPAATYDTFAICSSPGMSFLPVYIKYGDSKCWSWSNWTWTPTTGLSSATGVNNNINLGAISGITTYTITGTDSMSGMNSGAHRVFYLTILPCFNAGSNSPGAPGPTICVTDTLHLDAHGDSTGATYIWRGPGITGPVVGAAQFITRTGLSMADTGWYYVIRTRGTTHDTAKTHVLLKPLPVINATSNAPICSGSALNLSATPDSSASGETWLWSGPLGFSSTIPSPTIPTTITANTGIYKIKATFNGCSDSTTVFAQIDSTPAMPMPTSNTPVCSTFTLFFYGNDATPGVNWAWAGPSGFASILQNPSIANAPTTASGTYTLTTSLGTCTNTATIDVVVKPKPGLPAMGSNSPVCSQNMLNLTASTMVGSSYFWSGPNGFTSNVENPTISPVPTAATGVYSVYATLNGCYSDTATLAVVIDSTPVTPVASSNSPGAPAICQGDTLKLFASSATAGVSYSWSGPGSFASTLQNPIIPNVTPGATGLYQVTVSLGTSCTTSAIISVSITPTPPLSASSNTPVCSGDTLQLTATSSAGAAFSWQGPYTYFSNAQNPMRTPAMTEYSGVYTVQVTLYNCTNTVFDTVVVNLTPDAPMLPWLTYCNSAAAPPLQAWGDLGATILWYPNSTPGTAGSTVAPIPPTSADTVMWFYTTQTVNNCISSLDSMKVTVNPKPYIKASADRNLCPHDTATLFAWDTTMQTVSFHWRPAMYLSDTMGATVITTPETNTTYSVEATNMYDCRDTAKVHVAVHPSAVMFLGDPVTLYPGESYQFNPQTNCSTISWFPPAGLSDPYIFNPVATPDVSTIYVATGSTADGCVITDSLSITVNTEAVFGVPNAFAPGTGANNLFKVLKRGDATLNHFRVYDRWGVLVFETTDIDQGWDGMYKNVPQPLGVYVYDIEAVTNGGRVFHKIGNVTLLR